ncbi:MAG: hypothetical protein C0518_05510 [Opitutus sp.]|nr:hypothetical protein [Opitutus sp.]
MNALHVDLLLALRPAADFGLAAADLLTDMRRGRHSALTLPEIERALRELADRSFVFFFTSPLGSKRWRIGALGVSALQEEKL